MPDNTLPSRCIGIGIEESTHLGIVISGLEIIQPGLAVIYIGTITQRVGLAEGGGEAAGGGQHLSPGVVGILDNDGSAGIQNGNNITLQVCDIVIGNPVACHGGRITIGIICEGQKIRNRRSVIHDGPDIHLHKGIAAVNIAVFLDDGGTAAAGGFALDMTASGAGRSTGCVEMASCGSFRILIAVAALAGMQRVTAFCAGGSNYRGGIAVGVLSRTAAGAGGIARCVVMAAGFGMVCFITVSAAAGMQGIAAVHTGGRDNRRGKAMGMGRTEAGHHSLAGSEAGSVIYIFGIAMESEDSMA